MSKVLWGLWSRVLAARRAKVTNAPPTVIAVIAVLATLLLPALRAAREMAQGIRCLGQIKQFGYAWNMYAEDYEERIPPNYQSSGPAQINTNTWVRGWLDNGFTANLPDNTNTLYLTESLLGPYLGRSIAIWRCPGDKSTAPYGFQGNLFRLPRVAQLFDEHVPEWVRSDGAEPLEIHSPAYGHNQARAGHDLRHHR